MPKLVVLITAQIDQGHIIGEAWQAAGSSGVTIIEGHGLRHLQDALKNAELLPGIMSLRNILRDNDVTSLLLLSVVDSDALADKLIAVAQTILGDMQAPNNGILFMLDVPKIFGLRR